MLWKQINNDVNIQKYSEKLKEITKILQNECPDLENNPDFMGGRAGIATFLFYYAKFYD